MNWALRGYGKLLVGGAKIFPETRNAAAVKADLIKSARPEEMFCDEMLEKDPEAVVSSDAVYLAFRAHCLRNGGTPAGSNRVIPEICRYLCVEKPAPHGPREDRKRCLVGVKFIPGTEAGDTGF